MDCHYQVCSDGVPEWERHFEAMAKMAAEMFSLVADEEARVEEHLLEHPNDSIFKYLLTGFAKARTERSEALIRKYETDDESWVRSLTRELIRRYY